MNEAIVTLAAAQMARDMNRKVTLAENCDHRIRPMPIIDARVDYKCERCMGIIQGAV